MVALLKPVYDVCLKSAGTIGLLAIQANDSFWHISLIGNDRAQLLLARQANYCIYEWDLRLLNHSLGIHRFYPSRKIMLIRRGNRDTTDRAPASRYHAVYIFRERYMVFAGPNDVFCFGFLFKKPHFVSCAPHHSSFRALPHRASPVNPGAGGKALQRPFGSASFSFVIQKIQFSHFDSSIGLSFRFFACLRHWSEKLVRRFNVVFAVYRLCYRDHLTLYRLFGLCTDFIAALCMNFRKHLAILGQSKRQGLKLSGHIRPEHRD